MALQHPGSRAWTEALRAAYDGPLLPETKISLGGEIHDSLIPPEIKPGTRTYLTAMQNLGTTEGGRPHVYEDGIYDPGIYD